MPGRRWLLTGRTLATGGGRFGLNANLLPSARDLAHSDAWSGLHDEPLPHGQSRTGVIRILALCQDGSRLIAPAPRNLPKSCTTGPSPPLAEFQPVAAEAVDLGSAVAAQSPVVRQRDGHDRFPGDVSRHYGISQRRGTSSSPPRSTWSGWPPASRRCLAHGHAGRRLPGSRPCQADPGPLSEGLPATSPRWP